MQITIAPSSRQIRYFVSCAMNAFDTLPIKSAVETALSDLRQLLSYLDALDNGENVVVGGIAAIEGGVRLKSEACDGQALDLIHRYRDPPLTNMEPSQSVLPEHSDEENMRLHADVVAEKGE